MESDRRSARDKTGNEPPTLATIARHVGVSINTVSRALRAPNTVRADLRRRINSAMEELNYVPNRLAGGLSATRSDIVGVVVASLHYSEFAGIVDALQSGLLEHDLQVMLANTRYDADLEERLVRSLLSWRPAAMAIVGIDHPPKVIDLFEMAGIPIIEIWDTGGPVIDTAVGFDHEEVGMAQARHLVGEGYRRFAFVGSIRDNDWRARKRLKGVEREARMAGLADVVTVTSRQGGDPDLGDRLTREVIARHPEVDALICNNDVVAFGALRAAAALGRRVPQDIGVIAFGDGEASTCVFPALTTIRPDRDAIGRLTAKAVIERLNDRAPHTVVVDWTLMARGSTRRSA